MGNTGEELTEEPSGDFLLGWVSVVQHGKTVLGVQVDPNVGDYFEQLGKWLREDRGKALLDEANRTPTNKIGDHPAVTFFKQPCRCQPESFKGVLVDFLARYKHDKNLEDTCLRGLQIRKTWLDNLTVHYTLNLLRYRGFGGVGYVNVMRINDIESEVEAVCLSGDGPTIMDDRAEVYEASLDLMKALAKHLHYLYGGDRNITIELPPRRARDISRDQTQTNEENRQLRSVLGMVELIARRKIHMQKNLGTLNWTYDYKERIDVDTANLIDKDCAGKIRQGWYDKKVDGAYLIKVLMDTYPRYSYHIIERWKALEDSDF